MSETSKEKLDRMVQSLVGSDRVHAELLLAILKELRRHPLKKWLGRR